MRTHSWSCFIVTVLCCLCLATPAHAEDLSQEVLEELKALRSEVRELRQRIDDMEERERGSQALDDPQRARIPEGEQGSSDSAVGLTGTDKRPAIPASATTLPGQIKSILPEIGAVGDIVATSSEEGISGEGNDRIAVRHLELVFGSYLDPYSRFDATATFSDFEEAGLEEAAITHWGLPAGLKGRFGRFFPTIGKAASIHRDSLSTVDEPLVVRKFFGSEGYFRTGADITRIFEGPAGVTVEPKIGILEGGNGEGGRTFGDRRRPTGYGHLKLFKDLTELSNAELGFSFLTGSSDDDKEHEVGIFGTDATYIHHITPQNPLKLQGEFYLQHRQEANSIDATTGNITHFDRHPWGAYLLTDYRFAPRWSVGARADHVRLIDTAAPEHRADQALSAFLTFYQSEFARWRLQFRHEERAKEPTDDSVFLQGAFAIGTHKHQIQ